MDVIIDGKALEQIPEGAEGILDLIALLSDQLREQGRAIMSLEVDGTSVVPETMSEEVGSKPLGEAQRLAITTDDILKMVRDCLASLRESIPELPTVCRGLAELFQSENPEDGLEPFQELANAWSLIKRRQQLVCDALQIDPTSLEINGLPASEHHAELNSYLEEAIQALSDGDTVLLGDLLEYELAPRAETEVAFVGHLLARVPAKLS